MAIKNIKKILKSLPETPGIYKMLDSKSNVIYVGKAVNLKKRMSQYFQKDHSHSTRTRKLVSQTAGINTIQTDTELEAVILENNLIKNLRPKYNILMKDDKSYVYIKIDLNEDFPAISIVRAKQAGSLRQAGVRYFGPKLAVAHVYETLRTIKKIFPFRQCGLAIRWKAQTAVNDYESKNLIHNSDEKLVEVKNKVIRYPCLEYSIKQCPGPCIGAITPDEYKKFVQQTAAFLSGKNEEIQHSLNEQMKEAANKKLFEKAARIRNKLFAVNKIIERQKMTDVERKNTDIINFAADAGRIFFNIMQIREGKLIDQENFVLDALELTTADAPLDCDEMLESFISQYYERAADVPNEVFLPSEIQNRPAIEQWLSEKRGGSVKMLNPKKGEKNRLLELSFKNAANFAGQFRVKWMADQQTLSAPARLAETLGIKQKTLKRIEGYDISHLGGSETTGSMVVFENGGAKPQDYRHFKIRTLKESSDDCAALEEILRRRFKYFANRGKEIKIKTPNKNDFEFILKTISADEKINAAMRKKPPEKPEKKHFLAAKKDNKIIAFGRLFPLNNKISIISSLWVDPRFRGQRLGHLIIKKLIERSKLKRVYVNINKTLENYYSEFGFTVLHNVPEALLQRQLKALKVWGIKNAENYISMVYDVKKFKIDPSFSSKPDLIVIDGGKGQLNAAMNIMKKYGLQIPVIALAKKLEEIFMPGKKSSLRLVQEDEALKLLQRIRDESHRFAITFHRELHRKAVMIQ